MDTKPVGRTIDIKATTVFQKNWDAINSDKRFIKNEGGSRSSKTYSLCQVIILYCLQNPNKLVSIVRKTGPALKATVYRDFFEVMKQLDIYDENNHKKGDGMYVFDNGSAVEFFSADMEQKLRGRKRDIAWLNESNELGYDDVQQIALRTNDKIIFDYNPSAVESHLYHLPEDKTISIHSTYKDNPFLPKEIIDQIESYKFTDPDYYTIFALGLRAFSKENVYHEWPVCGKPDHLTEFIYAIDYGYTHPTAMVKLWYTPYSREIHIEELIYESHLISTDIIERMNQLGVDKRKVIVSETARPEIVADIKRAGYTIVNAVKDVKDGISNVKTFKMSIQTGSNNVIQENRSYRYKKVNGIVQEEVIKLYDDSMDAIRYGAMWIKKHGLKEANTGSQVFSFNF